MIQHIPSDKRCRPNGELMLVHRLRRWYNINPLLYERFVFPEIYMKVNLCRIQTQTESMFYTVKGESQPTVKKTGQIHNKYLLVSWICLINYNDIFNIITPVQDTGNFRSIEPFVHVTKESGVTVAEVFFRSSAARVTSSRIPSMSTLNSHDHHARVFHSSSRVFLEIFHEQDLQ